MNGILTWLKTAWIPLRVSWMRHNHAIGYVTRKHYYVFGIKVAQIQTSDPS